MTRPQVLGQRATSVLRAVLAGHKQVTAIALAAGVPRDRAYRTLKDLRDAGLVTWEPHTHGTIRALVKELPLTTGD